MKLLVIGGSGMLGADLCSAAADRGFEVYAPSSSELDITNIEHTASLALDPGWFDWCINCAAYTAVDKAESEREQAVDLNTLAPGYLAGACSMAGIKLIHISTDFVFDGSSSEPYAEDAPSHPLGVYGETKRQGELSVMSAHTNASVVRTSWLYGVHGRCFPKTMISAWEAGKQLRVIADQTGCPTFTVDLARVLLDMVDRNAPPDIYHACGPTATTWHRFAVEAITLWRDRIGSDRPVEVEPIPTEAYPTPARRPKYSVLSCERLYAVGIEPLRPLDVALGQFVGGLTAQ